MIYTVSGELREIIDADCSSRIAAVDRAGYTDNKAVRMSSRWNQELMGPLAELGLAEFLDCRATTLEWFDIIQAWGLAFGSFKGTASWNIDVPEASSEVKSTYYRTGQLLVPADHADRLGRGLFYWLVRLVQTEPVSNAIEIVGWLTAEEAMESHKYRETKDGRGFWTRGEELNSPETFPIVGFVPASLLKERAEDVKARTLRRLSLLATGRHGGHADGGVSNKSASGSQYGEREREERSADDAGRRRVRTMAGSSAG